MIPPQAIEIEESVLGAMIMDSPSVDVALETLSDDDFYKPSHRKIFQTISGLAAEKIPIDLLTVENHLKDSKLLDQVGGVGTLTQLTRCMTIGNMDSYCQIIKEKSMLRQIILKCQDLQKQAYDTSKDPYGVMDSFSNAAHVINSDGKIHSLTPSQIFEREKNTPKAEQLFTGNHTIDTSLCEHAGRTKGQVHLSIADSGHGKTAFGLLMAELLLQAGYKVHWFQLEDYDTVTAEYFRKVCGGNMDNIRICHDLYDIEAIKREARTVKREHGTDYIVFDYVQNIEAAKKTRSDQVEYISQQVTRIAKDLNVVSHVLGQITIDYGMRTGWKQEPRFGDVRWSQQLKQDAHIITSVFRPSRIESLTISDDQVKDWNDNPQPFNSVYVKQAKVRYGKQLYKRMHLIHTDKGLKPYVDESRLAPNHYERAGF